MYKIVCYSDQEVKINMRVIAHYQGGLFLQCAVGPSVGFHKIWMEAGSRHKIDPLKFCCGSGLRDRSRIFVLLSFVYLQHFLHFSGNDAYILMKKGI